MVEEFNTGDLLSELPDIEAQLWGLKERLEKLANLPPAQSNLPVIAHKLPDVQVLQDLDEAIRLISKADRRLRGMVKEDESPEGQLLLKIARIAQHYRANPPAPEDMSLRSPMDLAILGEVELLEQMLRDRKVM